MPAYTPKQKSDLLAIFDADDFEKHTGIHVIIRDFHSDENLGGATVRLIEDPKDTTCDVEIVLESIVYDLRTRNVESFFEWILSVEYDLKHRPETVKLTLNIDPVLLGGTREMSSAQPVSKLLTKVPDDQYVKDVCYIGHKEATCRYLMLGANGWSCVKNTTMAQAVDSRVEFMSAKSVNCNGLQISMKPSVEGSSALN